MKKFIQKDFNKKWFIIIFLVFCFMRILLACNQLVYVAPVTAPIDDMLMFRAAESIVDGNWLGDYNWLTMSKHMFFAVWLAFLHVLNIPMLLAGHILYVGACVVTVFAFAPVLKKNWEKILVLGFLLYNPLSWAEFTLRIYRDNIFPALCMLCISGVIGFCLRIHLSPKKGIGYAVIGGVGLATAWLTREDGIWLMPFVVCAIIFYILCVIMAKETVKTKIYRCMLAVIPFILLLVGVLSFSTMNYIHYGRFAISDFTSSDFENAIGAFSRADTTGAHPKVFVPHDVRLEIYDKVPLAKQLGDTLETDSFYNGYGSLTDKEFNSGGFYWAVRRAAFESGLASDAVSAKAFYTQLATDINKACDNGLIQTDNKEINSSMMPFHPEYISLTIAEMGNSFKQLLSLFWFDDEQHQIKPYSNELCFFEPSGESQEEVESFIHNDCAVLAQADTDLVYLTPRQNIFAKALGLITVIVRIIITPCTVFALVWLCKQIAFILKCFKTKTFNLAFMSAIVYFGLFCSILLRVAMISYVEAVSFQIGTYAMYLSSAMPFLLLFAVLGTIWLFNSIFIKNTRKNP